MANTLTENVRGRNVGNDGFPVAVARVIRDRKARAEELLAGPYAGLRAQQRVTALDDLEKHVLARSLSDPTLYSLYFVQGHRGQSNDWNPGSNQEDVLSLVGGGPYVPTPENVLAELVSAGLEDLVEGNRAQVTEARQAAQEAEARAAAGSAAELQERADELASKAAEFEGLRAELEQERQRATHALNLLSARENLDKATKPVRRRSTPKQPAK